LTSFVFTQPDHANLSCYCIHASYCITNINMLKIDAEKVKVRFNLKTAKIHFLLIEY